MKVVDRQGDVDPNAHVAASASAQFVRLRIVKRAHGQVPPVELLVQLTADNLHGLLEMMGQVRDGGPPEEFEDCDKPLVVLIAE